MGWATVARRDFREVWTHKFVRWMVYFLLFVFVMGGYVYPPSVETPVSTDGFPAFMTGWMGLLIPLAAILLGHNAIVGERESGELALTLSLPHSRRDVVLGKLAARGGLVVVATLAGLLLAGALVVYPYGSLGLPMYVAYLALTTLFSIAFVGIAMAISSFARTQRVAAGAAFGVFFLFVVIWDPLRAGIRYALEYIGFADGGLPNWALFLYGAEPVSLYERIIQAFWEGSTTGPYLGPDAPWYLGGWVALVLLVAWALGPLAVGYYRFGRTDL